jgi:oxygen-independent coproporphyrinogen-3 oxidase
MFAVNLNRANFEYDVHSIVKAFWPEEQVSVLTPETKEEKRAELEAQVRLDIVLQDEGAVISVGEDTYEWIFGGEKSPVTPGDTYKDSFKRFLYLLSGKSRRIPFYGGFRPSGYGEIP